MILFCDILESTKLLRKKMLLWGKGIDYKGAMQENLGNDELLYILIMMVFT